MTTLHPSASIRHALEGEIAGMLGESVLSIFVDITERDFDGKVYSVKGAFKVSPFFLKMEGKFDAKLDENLKVITLRITETT